jgi:hypothetical protein
MRLNDLNNGSIKTLLILALLAANIAIALAFHRAPLQLPGSARDSRVGFDDRSIQVSGRSALEEKIRDGGSPSPARGSRALPSHLPP